jgi:hypothetical protein
VPEASAGATANPSGEGGSAGESFGVGGETDAAPAQGGEAGSGGVATIVPDSEPEAELGEFGCGADPAAKPVEILATDRPTIHLAVAGDLLYFMEHSGLPDTPGLIGRVPVGGGEVEYVVRELNRAAPIAVAGTSLIFNSNSGIARLPLSGGTPEVIDPATSLLATWDSRLYWLTGSPLSNTSVFKAYPSFDGPPSPELTLADSIDVVTALAANATVVYFASYFGELGGASMTRGTVRMFPKADYFPANSLTVNSTGAYYAAGTPEDRNTRSVILKASLDGDERRIFARGGGGGSAGIAVDAEYVYFVDRNDDSPDPLACVKKKPLAGGAPTLVATWPNNYGFGLTIDQTHVYVSDGNTIMRAHK